MFILAIISLLFNVYTIMLMARIIGSWFPEYHRHPLFLFIAFYTDPYLNLFRNLIPPLGMLDLSPIVAFVSLSILEFLIKALVVAIIT